MGNYYNYIYFNLSSYYSTLKGKIIKKDEKDNEEGLLNEEKKENKNEYKLLKNNEEFEIKDEYDNKEHKNEKLEDLKNEIKINFSEYKIDNDDLNNIDDLKKQILIEKTEDFDI